MKTMIRIHQVSSSKIEDFDTLESELKFLHQENQKLKEDVISLKAQLDAIIKLLSAKQE